MKTSKLSGFRSGSNRAFRMEEDRKFNKALGVLFHRNDSNKLTDEAIKACRMIDVHPEDLLHKGADYFMREGAVKVSEEIAEVRYKHFMTKRTANILRVYDYMLLAGMLRGN
jgi:hypothetical protein